MTYNDGNFLPDTDHPHNAGPCRECDWDVYAPAGVEPIHFACDMNAARQLQEAR